MPEDRLYGERRSLAAQAESAFLMSPRRCLFTLRNKSVFHCNLRFVLASMQA